MFRQVGHLELERFMVVRYAGIHGHLQPVGGTLKIGAFTGGLRRWPAFGFGPRCKPFGDGGAPTVIGQAGFPADVSFREPGAQI